MKLVRESSLEEYARQFWQRQSKKRTPDDLPALRNIESGGDPVNWLVDLYPYKLPKPCNAIVQIVMIETPSEAERLLLHDYMIKDDWTVERCLVPCPKTRRLGKMVTTALEKNYFETGRSDTQIRIYEEWSSKTTTSGLILEDGLPLIEMTWPAEFEIVDGWGRLHALLALVRKGLSFEPFKCFAASRVRI
jgi:hypothetical protein